MTTFSKNKKRQAIIILFVLLLLAFFWSLKINQNSSEVSSFLPWKFNYQNLKEELLKGNNNYAELEISDSRDDDALHLNDDDNLSRPSDGDQDTINHYLYENNGSVNEITNTNSEKNFPKILNIPKLEISANVQSVGLNSNQEMDVPSNDQDVAWYNLGSRPGEIGSAVLSGHLDGRTGQPAVFWDIQKLEAGDDIYVVDGNDNKKHFQVTAIETYQTGAAPLEKIFGANDGIYLNLVTCGGVWDKEKNNYSERLVIFAEYVFD